MFFIVLHFIEIRLILQKGGIKNDAEENRGIKGMTYNSDLLIGRGPSLWLLPPVGSHSVKTTLRDSLLLGLLSVFLIWALLAHPPGVGLSPEKDTVNLKPEMDFQSASPDSELPRALSVYGM